MTLDDSLDLETQGRIRQFCRLLISYNDFKHAAEIALYILKQDFRDRQKGEKRVLQEALNSAMIVAYCRPFSGNDKNSSKKIPDLPGKFLRILSDDERRVHSAAIDDRNTLLAHSDSQAWNLRPTALDTGHSKILVPLSNDTRAPLTREATETLHSAAIKMMEAVFQERMKWEPNLIQYFDVVQFDDEEIEALRKQFLGTKSSG